MKELREILSLPITREKLGELEKYLLAQQPIAGNGVRVSSKDRGGVLISATGRGRGTAAVAHCQLGDMLAHPDQATNPGKFYLRKGLMNWLEEHVEIGGPDGTLFTPTAGHYVWISISITATEEDDVLTGGWSATTPTLTSGATLPDDHVWEPGAATGNAIIPLGRFSDPGAIFEKYGCGSVSLRFCVNEPTRGLASFFRG